MLGIKTQYEVDNNSIGNEFMDNDIAVICLWQTILDHNLSPQCHINVYSTTIQFIIKVCINDKSVTA